LALGLDVQHPPVGAREMSIVYGVDVDLEEEPWLAEYKKDTQEVLVVTAKYDSVHGKRPIEVKTFSAFASKKRPKDLLSEIKFMYANPISKDSIFVFSLTLLTELHLRSSSETEEEWFFVHWKVENSPIKPYEEPNELYPIDAKEMMVKRANCQKNCFPDSAVFKASKTNGLVSVLRVRDDKGELLATERQVSSSDTSADAFLDRGYWYFLDSTHQEPFRYQNEPLHPVYTISRYDKQSRLSDVFTCACLRCIRAKISYNDKNEWTLFTLKDHYIKPEVIKNRYLRYDYHNNWIERTRLQHHVLSFWVKPLNIYKLPPVPMHDIRFIEYN
jgi:hypothetical protein